MNSYEQPSLSISLEDLAIIVRGGRPAGSYFSHYTGPWVDWVTERAESILRQVAPRLLPKSPRRKDQRHDNP